MIDYAVELKKVGRSKGEMRDAVRQHTKDKYPGNPVVVWILLNVMLPIVIKLVMRWWEKRNQE